MKKAPSLAAAVARRSDYCRKPCGRAAATAWEGASISRVASDRTLPVNLNRDGESELGQALALALALGFAEVNLDMFVEVTYEQHSFRN